MKILPVFFVILLFSCSDQSKQRSAVPQPEKTVYQNKWIERAYLIGKQFYKVYNGGWESGYGAIGDAYLFRVTGDSLLLHRYTTTFDLKKMDNGTWVDDRAWICLAELYWWEFSGKTNRSWIDDARQRYLEARAEGRLSNHEGFWSWYNYPPQSNVREPIFTNSNMNQLVGVACKLYDATGDQRFLNDALLVWNGDNITPGIEKQFYRGNGLWGGKSGKAAFGKELPWESASYLSVLAALYHSTNNTHFKEIAVASAKHITDPKNGWVDLEDFYQIHMDGNGAFVNFLLDAYMIAPDELQDIPGKVEKMLDHVWTNHHGHALLMLHRTYDHGIRNGWNPNGGEDGYGVDEIGTVHAQGEALRAFGVFAYVKTKLILETH